MSAVVAHNKSTNKLSADVSSSKPNSYKIDNGVLKTHPKALPPQFLPADLELLEVGQVFGTDVTSFKYKFKYRVSLALLNSLGYKHTYVDDRSIILVINNQSYYYSLPYQSTPEIKDNDNDNGYQDKPNDEKKALP